MMLDIVPYLIVLMAGALTAMLLTSKALAQKLVSAGMLPRAFLNLVPMIQTVMRVFGVTLVITGIAAIGIQAGWINREYLTRYGFATAVLVLGVIVLILSSRNRD